MIRELCSNSALLFIGTALLMALPVSSCEHRKNEQTSRQGSEPLRIAVAANMQFAIEALSEEFTRQTGTKCDLIISSSGKLTAQIREGAPFDVLISADMKYPEEVYRSGLAVTEPIKYAYGRLVLWTMDDLISPNLELMADPRVKHIAVANPVTAPYGKAALEVITKLGMLTKTQDKLVYGESIAQTNQFIVSRSTELGFTAMSVVLSPEIVGKGRWIVVPDSLHHPIDQGAVAVKREGNDQLAGKKFCEFLTSSAARDILAQYGYGIPANDVLKENER